MNLGLHINYKTLVYEYNSFFSNEEIPEIEVVYDSINSITNKHISIIIPTFNRPLLLKEAIASIINQNAYDNYEIVIVDNCSSNENFQLLKDYVLNSNFKNLKLIRALTSTNSWNLALSIASSTWVVMLHDDDLLKSNYFKKINVLLQKFPSASLISSSTNFLVQTNLKFLQNLYVKFILNIFKLKDGCIYRISESDLFYYNFCPNTGMIFNRDKAFKIFGFQSDFKPISDYVFAYRMVRTFGEVYFYNKKITYLRLLDNAGSNVEQINWVKSKLIEFKSSNLLMLNQNKKIKSFYLKLLAYSNNTLDDSIFKKSKTFFIKCICYTIENLYVIKKISFSSEDFVN